MSRAPRPGIEPDVAARIRSERAADLGPRGIELRDLIDEYAAAHADDPIVRIAMAALAAETRYRKDELGPPPPPPPREWLRQYLADVRRTWLEDPSHPGAYRAAGGVLFRTDGPNHLRPAEPIIRRLGDPVRPPSSIRASERRFKSAQRRAVRVAKRFFAEARRRDVWTPSNLAFLYTIFIGTAHARVQAQALIEALSPRAAVVLATPNHGPRAFVDCAREAGVPTIYFPHAPALMDPALNDLPTDYAGVRGPIEVDYYAEVIGPCDRIEVVGDPSIGSAEMASHDPSMPPVLAPPYEPNLSEVLPVVREAVDGPLIVAPHPHAETESLRARLPSEWTLWEGRTLDLLAQGPPCVMQCSSGVSLEALRLGVPPIELRIPVGRTITYPLIREPYVRVVESADELRHALAGAREDAASMGARRALREWALRWVDPVGEEAAARGAALVERAAAAPAPGAIWSAWPGPGE